MCDEYFFVLFHLAAAEKSEALHMALKDEISM